MQALCKTERGLASLIARSVFLLAVLTLPLALSSSTPAAVGGSISGTVKDATGGVIAKATITVTNIETGVEQTAVSNDAGAYSFPTLPVGHYNLDATDAGFRPYRRAGIAVDVNSTILVDAALELGAKCGSGHGNRIGGSSGDHKHSVRG